MNIAGADIAGEAVGRIVGDADRILLVLEADDRQDGAEYLLARENSPACFRENTLSQE